ncbi:MAG: RDD family protein, partial [Pseudomonadota bacterium]
GMKAWRLELVSADGSPFTWPQLITRALIGILAWVPAGAGIWWQYLDAEGRTWHDRVSATRMVVLKKRKKT